MSHDSGKLSIEALMYMVVNSMTRQADSRLSEELGLSLAQVLILKHIHECSHRFNQKEIAEHLGVTSASISRHIKHLIELDLIETKINPENRRENLLMLTGPGIEKFKDGKQILDSMMKALMLEVDDVEREQLRATLTKLYNTLST